MEQFHYDDVPSTTRSRSPQRPATSTSQDDNISVFTGVVKKDKSIYYI